MTEFSPSEIDAKTYGNVPRTEGTGIDLQGIFPVGARDELVAFIMQLKAEAVFGF